jgi:hypothetical protein
LLVEQIESNCRTTERSVVAPELIVRSSTTAVATS